MLSIFSLKLMVSSGLSRSIELDLWLLLILPAILTILDLNLVWDDWYYVKVRSEGVMFVCILLLLFDIEILELVAPRLQLKALYRPFTWFSESKYLSVGKSLKSRFWIEVFGLLEFYDVPAFWT